ncbi:MAG: hypothetical protein JWM11_4610, partial [Planctomycetaceae bacterium]|nr:hypothetical protein [Planctomycetaceae bacterium]
MTEKTATETPPAKPARSPVERTIVWGVIGLGLLVVGLEAKAHFDHSAVLNALKAKLDQFENGEADGGVTKDDVVAIMGSRVPVTSEKVPPGATSMGADWLDIYEFKGLVRTRQLYVYYGIQGKQNQPVEVMIVQTGPAETLQEAMDKFTPAPASSETGGQGLSAPMGGGAGPAGPGAGGPGAGGPGMGGGGGGGRRGRGAGRGRPATEGADAKKDAGADTKATDAKSDAPKSDEPKKEDAKKEEPKTEEPKKEEPKAAEPKVEETKKEEP